ncbi:MAG TPA: ABC transporter permease [Tepidisphaeraceae bacterium]|jgi:ribose transport system permease protein
MSEQTAKSNTLIKWLNILGTFLALLAIFGYFAFLVPDLFLTMRNIENIFRQTVIVGIGAMGMTLVMISGGIDLSVGSLVALVTVVVALALQQGYNPWMAALFGALAGMIGGALNGILITALRVVPFIITLGTLLIFRGLAQWWANDQKIDAPETFLSNLIAMLPKSEKWMLFAPAVWFMFLIVLGMAALLRYTKFGRHAIALGSNEQTARLCGIRVPWVKIMIYAVGGFLVGIAGVAQFARLTVGDPTVAVGLELDIIAAVVIGGGSLNGGEGSALGSLIGALIMTVIQTGCAYKGWDTHVQLVVTGVIIIVAVALDQLRHRRTT